MTTRAPQPLALLVALAGGGAVLSGCANPISNDIFASDRIFLEALPSRERHVVEVDEESPDLPAAATLPADAPFLLQLTVGVAESSNSNVLEILEYVDAVRALPPTTREANHRSWGPYQHEADLWIKVDMTREGRSIYDWSFSVSTAEDGLFTPFFYGAHFAGDSVVDGDGAFVWDWAALGEELGVDTSGQMVVDYDHRVGKELLVDFDQVRGDQEEALIDGSYWFWSDGVAGEFEVRFPMDVYDPDEDPDTAGQDELLQASTRWLAGEGGRSDGTSWEGDWEDGGLDVTQCWDAGSRLVYQSYDAGWLLEEGDPTRCVYTEASAVEHLSGEGPPG